MATAQIISQCPFCNQPVPSEHDDDECPECHAPPDWMRLLQALDFSVLQFEGWHQQGRIPLPALQNLTAYYQNRRQALIKAKGEGQPVPEDKGMLGRAARRNDPTPPRSPGWCSVC